nr:putative ribonuclease h protein [Quercus suber]
MDDDQDNEFSQEINGENDVVEGSKIEDSNDEENGTKHKDLSNKKMGLRIRILEEDRSAGLFDFLLQLKLVGLVEEQHVHCPNPIPWNPLEELIPFCYFAVWGLWKHRNRVVFENTTLNHSLHKSCINLAIEYFFCVGKSVQPRQQGCILIKWNKPNVGWHKLKTDGASMGNLGKAGGGGVIRDHRGSWVQGFARKIGITTSVIAEFWALGDGLTMAAQLGITLLEIEMDAKILVDLVLSNSNSNKECSPLLNDCRLFGDWSSISKRDEKLSCLRTLSDFNIGGKDDGEVCKLRELKNLNQLQGSLRIYGLRNVVDVDEAQIAELKKKTHLSRLVLHFGDGEDQIEMTEAEAREENEGRIENDMDDDQDSDSREEINHEDDLIEVKETEDSNHEEDGAEYKNNEEVGVDNDERVICRPDHHQAIDMHRTRWIHIMRKRRRESPFILKELVD